MYFMCCLISFLSYMIHPFFSIWWNISFVREIFDILNK
nr:MAG TPA: hypothetical protein [Caudoviricetes sp.]